MVTKPQITMHLLDAIFAKIINGCIDFINNIPMALLCMTSHMQAVEMYVKEVTALSFKICGYERRYRYIKTKMVRRKRMTVIDKKYQFNV